MIGVEGSVNKFREWSLGQRQKVLEPQHIMDQEMFRDRVDRIYQVDLKGQEMFGDQVNRIYQVDLEGQEMFSD